MHVKGTPLTQGFLSMKADERRTLPGAWPEVMTAASTSLAECMTKKEVVGEWDMASLEKADCPTIEC